MFDRASTFELIFLLYAAFRHCCFVSSKQRTAQLQFGNRPGYFRAAFGYCKNICATPYMSWICQFHDLNTNKYHGEKNKIKKKKTTGVTNAFSNSFCSFQRLSKSLCSPVSIPNMPGIYHNTSDWYFIPPHFLSITSERYEKALTKLPLENICSETSIRTVHTYLWWLFWIVSHVKNIYILRHAWPYMSSADVLYK